MLIGTNQIKWRVKSEVWYGIVQNIRKLKTQRTFNILIHINGSQSLVYDPRGGGNVGDSWEPFPGAPKLAFDYHK